MEKIFKNVMIVDVNSGVVNEKTDIRVDRNKIVEIKRRTDAVEKTGAAAFDADDYFAIPGLMDLHTHLIWSGDSDPVKAVDEEGHDVSILHAAQNAKISLQAGITTVRDLGSNSDIAIALGKAIEKGYTEGARVVASGRTLIMTGGHDPFWGIELDGEAEALKAVRLQVGMGAQVIKVSATGGVYGRMEGEAVGRSELNFHELKIIADEAHRFGLKVAAHSISLDGIENCIHAGIDTIEHGHFLNDAAMNDLKKKNIYWVPTLYVYRKIAEGENIPDYAVKKARKIVDTHKKAFLRAMELDVPIAAGSDAGSPNTPHGSLLDELKVMVEYGATPLYALRTATLHAAKALGRDRQMGTIETGKTADMVFLKKNPLDDISNLETVAWVMKDGEIKKIEPIPRS